MNSTLTYRPKSPDTNIGGYRYFFNGQEGDNEVFGESGLFAFEFRMHDARLGRFWSVDPLAAKYPWNSTYAFAENRVIDGRELEGLEYISVSKSGVDPSKHRNKDGTYSFSIGNYKFNNVKIVKWNGKRYFNINQHLYYGKRGWSMTGDRSEIMTQWVYTDIQNFDPNTMHTYTWADSKLQGLDKEGHALNENCAELASAQAKEVGTSLVKGMVSKEGALNYVGNSLITLNNCDAIDYINRQLEAGNAIVVGVSYTMGGTTNHYVTITGRTTFHGLNVFTFIENGVSNKYSARDPRNILFSDENLFQGVSPNRKNGKQQYYVTRIQRNIIKQND